MTATELQDQIIRILANRAYTRYWLNWPSSDEKKYMAVSVAEISEMDQATFVECPDLEEKGFTRQQYGGGALYAIERTKDKQEKETKSQVEELQEALSSLIPWAIHSPACVKYAIRDPKFNGFCDCPLGKAKNLVKGE